MTEVNVLLLIAAHVNTWFTVDAVFGSGGFNVFQFIIGIMIAILIMDIHYIHVRMQTAAKTVEDPCDFFDPPLGSRRREAMAMHFALRIVENVQIEDVRRTEQMQ
jgi:hypothetical protein